MSGILLTSDSISRAASGLIEVQGFLGNQALTSAGQAFQRAAQAGGSLGSIVDAIRNNKTKSQTKSISGSELSRAFDLPWTDEIVAEITKVANKIAQLSNIRVEDAEDFLYILITTDSHEVMTKFATATDIAELADASIMMKPMEILAIPGIEKVAYLADAISAILKAYKKYFQDDNYANNTNDMFDNKQTMDAITNALGILTSALSNESSGTAPISGGSPGALLGPIMSLLLHGKEIPMGVQANNPLLLPRTIIGMTMFGASPHSTSTFDPLKFPTILHSIANFGDLITGGAANAGFISKNQNSISSPQSLSSIISALSGFKNIGELAKNTAKVFATLDPDSKEGSKLVKKGGNPSNLGEQIGTKDQTPKVMPSPPNIIENIVKGIGNMVTGSLGAKITDMVEMSKADNAIPILGAMANALNSIQDFIPEVNNEMREALSTITTSMDGIGKLYSTMTNLQNALKQGMDPTTLASALVSGAFGSVIKPPSLFPTSVFQGGWTHMSSVNQALAKDNRFYQQVLYILNNLG